MNTSKLGVSILGFIAALMTLVAGYLALTLYSPGGANVSLSLAPGLGLPRPAEARAAPTFPETRQFELFLIMFEDESGEEHHRWFPSNITANVGDTLILRVVNNDSDAAHGFGIAGYGIFDDEIAIGANETFQFVADRAGIFRYACAKDECAADHADQQGQLIVLSGQ